MKPSDLYRLKREISLITEIAMNIAKQNSRLIDAIMLARNDIWKFIGERDLQSERGWSPKRSKALSRHPKKQKSHRLL